MSISRVNTRRRGVTLVEIVGVMIAGSLVVSVTMAAVVGALRADRRLAANATAEHAIADLADRLRRDIHAADRVAWDDAARQLNMTLPGAVEVRYQWVDGPDRVERWVKETNNADPQLSGATALPRRTSIAVEPSSAVRGELITIRLTTRPPARRSVERRRLPCEVVAAVGRDGELVSP